VSGRCDACDGSAKALLIRGVHFICLRCVDSPQERALVADRERMIEAAKANGGKLL